MHIIFIAELKYYFDTKFGGNIGESTLEKYGYDSKAHLHFQEYPDYIIMGIITEASGIAKKSVNEVLEDFGEFVTPYFIRMYRPLIHSDWKTLDLIENADKTIHKIVRMKNPGAAPPEIKCFRPKYDEVVITYNSHRKMCGIVKGIAKGLARHYSQQIYITETNCMLKGNSSCIITIKLIN